MDVESEGSVARSVLPTRATDTPDSGIVMVDGMFFGVSFKQDQSLWDDHFRDLGYFVPTKIL